MRLVARVGCSPGVRLEKEDGNELEARAGDLQFISPDHRAWWWVTIPVCDRHARRVAIRRTSLPDQPSSELCRLPASTRSPLVLSGWRWLRSDPGAVIPTSAPSMGM